MGLPLRRIAIVLTALLIATGFAEPAHAETASITGTITDLTTGEPLAGVCVTASDYFEHFEAGSGCSGADGRYVLDVPEGSYRIKATGAGYHELWANNATTMNKAAMVQVYPWSELGPVDFRLFHETATVTGRVSLTNGAAVPFADVRVFEEQSYDYWGAPFATTDANGRYTVSGIAPGRHLVQITSGYGQAWAYSAPTREEATVFNLGDGATITVDQQFLPPGSVEATVLDDVSGAPITSGCVEILYGYRACEAPDGVYRFPSVGDGTQTLKIDIGTHLPVTATVVVTRGAISTITIRLKRAEKIVTRVVDRQTNQPVAGACVWVTPANGRGLNTNQPSQCSGSDGRLTISLRGAPGTYQLFVRTPNGSYGAQWVAGWGGTGDQLVARKVTVGPSANVTLPDIKMDRPGSITGVLRNSDGTPASFTCVYAYAPSINYTGHGASACADVNGRYTASGLGPYDWPLLFTGQSWIWSGNKPQRFGATKVHVTAGGTATMDATIPAGGRITGVMKDATGNPRSGSVTAYSVVTGDYAGPAAYAWYDGSYTLSALTPGQQVRIEYSMSATGPNQPGANCTYPRVVTIVDSRTINLDLTGCG